MRALIWKEYREKWIWLLLLSLMSCVVVLRDIGYTFLGQGSMWEITSIWSGWVFLPAVGTLIMGAGSFAGELDAGAGFLFSRPVSWKKLLIAKVAVGMFIIVASTLVSAILFRINLPEPYVRFASPERILMGVVYAVAIMSVYYLMGLVASPVVPRSLGGVLVVLCIYTLIAALVGLSVQLLPGPAWGLWAIFVGISAGAITAMFLLARFGLTLNARARVIRYATVVCAVALPFIALDIAVPFGPAALLPRHEASMRYAATSFSPDGRYLLAPVEDGSYRFIRLRDLHALPCNRSGLPLSIYNREAAIHWTGAGIAHFITYFHDHSIDRAGLSDDQHQLNVFSALDESCLSVQRIPVPSRNVSSLVSIPSPDGKRLLVTQALMKRFSFAHNMLNTDTTIGRAAPGANESYVDLPASEVPIEVIDIASGSKLLRHTAAIKNIWWQSNAQVGYIDARGHRRIISVPESSRSM